MLLYCACFLVLCLFVYRRFRSAIKKILERDDSASRSMVLCVASLNVKAFDKNNESANAENQRKNVQVIKVKVSRNRRARGVVIYNRNKMIEY